MKRIASFLMLFFLVGGLSAYQASGVSAGPCFTFPNLSGAPGSQVVMGLAVSNANAILAVEATVTYPADKLDVVSVDTTSFAGGMSLAANTATPGSILIAMAGANGISGNGDLFSIKFALKGSPGAVANVLLTRIVVNDIPAADCVTNGSITISIPTVPSLAASFGTAGLWLYRNDAWSPLTGISPDHMAGYDSKLAANFPGYGLYQYDGTNWTLLTSYTNINKLVGASNRLIVDFVGLGLFQYDGTTWTPLSSLNADKLLVNGSRLLAYFAGFGLFEHDGTTWNQLTLAIGVDDMVSISGKAHVDFGALGLWKYDAGWTNVSTANPNKIQTYDGRLVANFPVYGLFECNGTPPWTQLTANDTVQDLIGVGDSLYADFGPLGLYRWRTGAWSGLSLADPNRMGSYGDKLVVNFPGYGLYEFDGTNWKRLAGPGVTDMVGVELP
jgi:hypothetical protein